MNSRKLILGAIVGGLALSASSAAMAQCTNTNVVVGNVAQPNGTPLIAGLDQLGTLLATSAASVASAIANVNTVFLTQSGSAFVSAPANPPPNADGGGVWVRGVGGEADVRSNSSTVVSALTPAIGRFDGATIDCPNEQNVRFAGVQAGVDMARLNWNGWNIHLGTTAGYLSTRSNQSGGIAPAGPFSTDFEVPFIGTYLVATHGRFFADLMVREDFYNIDINNPGFNFFNQGLTGRGFSVAGNVGYNFAIPNSTWFIEPSAGFTWSETSFDPFTVVGQVGNELTGTQQIGRIESQIARGTLRIGTTVDAGSMILQPFLSGSVFHEFGDNVTVNYASCPFCVFLNPPGAPMGITATSSISRIGTYGQYSAGVAGQIKNTGWLGFVRVDYRNGDNIEGWTGNGGIRYQFTPEMLAAVMPTKFKAPARAAIAPINWTGFYLGVHAGVSGGGWSDIDLATGLVASTASVRMAGVLGGGQIGYNWQVPNTKWVLGIEGDISGANIHGEKTCGFATGVDNTGNTVAFSPIYLSCDNQIDWLATVTGKVGYAWGDRTLVYVKGGAAYAEQDVSVNCILNPATNNAANVRNCRNPVGVITNGFGTSEDSWGWTAGFGSEFALTNNWSAKAEYNFIDLGRRNSLASDGTTIISSHTDLHVTKLGLNYRFAATPVPVAAPPVRGPALK